MSQMEVRGEAVFEEVKYRTAVTKNGFYVIRSSSAKYLVWLTRMESRVLIIPDSRRC